MQNPKKDRPMWNDNPLIHNVTLDDLADARKPHGVLRPETGPLRPAPGPAALVATVVLAVIAVIGLRAV